LGAALLIAAKDLRLRVRDRSAFILGIIAPLTLAFIFNAVFGSAASGAGLGLEYGLVDLDGSEISSVLGSVLEGAEDEEILTLQVFPDVDEADAAIADGLIDAYFVMPTGFGQAVASNGHTTIRIVGDIDAPTSTQIAAAFAEQFATGVGTSQLAVATAATIEGTPVTPEFVGSLSASPSTAANSFSITDISAASKQLDASTSFAAGMATFVHHNTVQFGVTGLLEEDREGTLARLMAAPIPRGSVIAGKGILSFALGVISMTVLVVATSLPFLLGGVWGAPLGVAVLVVAAVLSAVGIMGLVAAAAKTPEGAGNLGAIIAVIMGMLGGTFFPIGSSGSFLAKLTYLTPHAWFLRGLAELSSDSPWTAALPAAGAIMVIALVTGGIAFALLKRRWVR
jgi:ABC-2 type transport system permease protein